MTIPADPLYQHLSGDGGETVLALRQTGETPRPYRRRAAAAADRGGPDRRHERVSIPGLSSPAFSRATRSAFLDHERAKSELKALMPEDAKEASGHGVRAKRSKSGAVSFDLLVQEDSDAAVQ